ncbi:hypothetical protein U9M48_029887 [Paspalum notatum var. saurae]|uniref:Protein kinase domain-containing protein n=1 Tax=Paspalum notatum var. saurae TaxID=547442 RepID=A0AAQ3TZS3_PASNO
MPPISLVLIAIFLTKRSKRRRARKLKQKFFTLNRRQLLKQSVSQRADITERMIITLDELEKSTNKFDEARELGGGGHGTVYKSILPDLHVVAIKKSNIVSDFGASKYIPIEKSGLTMMVQGTLGYFDPMYFYACRLNDKSDVYSFGVVLVELLTRRKTFPCTSEDEISPTYRVLAIWSKY